MEKDLAHFCYYNNLKTKAKNTALNSKARMKCFIIIIIFKIYVIYNYEKTLLHNSIKTCCDLSYQKKSWNVDIYNTLCTYKRQLCCECVIRII